jgi:hypothetical protein
VTQKFRRVFGAGKPVIGLVHFGALPGSPLYDAERGVAGRHARPAHEHGIASRGAYFTAPAVMPLIR